MIIYFVFKRDSTIGEDVINFISVLTKSQLIDLSINMRSSRGENQKESLIEFGKNLILQKAIRNLELDFE